MSNLKIEIKKRHYPYKDDISAPFNLWGEFIITCEESVLLDTEWDITVFIEWFIENKEYLKIEKFPFDFVNSIAESRDLLFNKVDTFNEEQEEEMFEYVEVLSNYFSNHYLHLRGTDTQSFYIGLVQDGRGEISYTIDNTYYKYIFDMEKFLVQVDEEIKGYLKTVKLSEESQSYFKEILGSYYSYIGSTIE